jgi:C4-type Zn-finger protein
MLREEVCRRVKAVLERGNYNITNVVMDIVQKSFVDFPESPAISGNVRAVLEDALRMAKSEGGIRSAGYRLRRLVRALEEVVVLPLTVDESSARARIAEERIRVLEAELTNERKLRSQMEKNEVV